MLHTIGIAAHIPIAFLHLEHGSALGFIGLPLPVAALVEFKSERKAREHEPHESGRAHARVSAHHETASIVERADDLWVRVAHKERLGRMELRLGHVLKPDPAAVKAHALGRGVGRLI